MKILTINAGSSSIKLELFEQRAGELTSITQLQTTPEQSLADRLPDSVDAVVHRIVHGGRELQAPCLITAEVEEQIRAAAPLAPLHNPVALEQINTCRKVMGEATPHIAVFDTAYFAKLPQVAATYGLPLELSEHFGIRRYGFHGLAHEAMWQAWCHARPDLERGGRVITLQLGAGCSAAAIQNGTPLDTSMGFSPFEGLLMGTRAGDLDVGILLYLQKVVGISLDEISDLLSHGCGLMGISGISSDMQQLLESTSPRAQLAVDVFCYRVRKYIGAYAAVLGGVDGLVFGGGIGEHAPEIRTRISNRFEWAGISERNMLLVQVNEARLMAEQAAMVLGEQNNETHFR